eukprot:scaffold1420_cov375-Pavlova_lutheri.AAC.12
MNKLITLFLTIFILLVLPAQANGNYRRPHNRRRCMHRSGRLSRDRDLQRRAQQWANRCVRQHSQAVGYVSDGVHIRDATFHNIAAANG